MLMTFPFRGLDENDYFHLGTFDAVRGNFAAASGRGSPFHSLEGTNMLKQALEALRQDLSAATALFAGVSQLGAAKALLEPTTADAVVYASSVLIATATGYFTLKYFRRARQERFHPSQASMCRTLSVVFLILSFTALAPATYRALIVHTTLLMPKPLDGPQPVIIGTLLSKLMPSAHAATPEVLVTAVLDTSRTSVRCDKAVGASSPPSEVTEWQSCRRFSVPQEDIERFLSGWRYYDPSGESEARREFERRYWSRTVRPAHRAMLAIPRLASNPVVRNFEFPIKIGLYHEWKQRLFAENLLPTAAEWAKLREETPELAAALRRYLVEVVGVLDPTFIVSIQNKSGQPVQISSLLYSARLIKQYKATMLTGYELPKYVLELTDGTHAEPMIPPVVVPPNSIATFDLLITMKEPRPGHEYELSLSFGSPGIPRLTSLTPVNLVF